MELKIRGFNNGDCWNVSTYLPIKHHFIAFSVFDDIVQILCQLQTLINMCFKANSPLRKRRRKSIRKAWCVGSYQLEIRNDMSPLETAQGHPALSSSARLRWDYSWRLLCWRLLFNAPPPRCICSFSLLGPTADSFCSQGLIPQAIILITQGENLPPQLIDAIMEVINNRRAGLVFSCRQDPPHACLAPTLVVNYPSPNSLNGSVRTNRHSLNVSWSNKWVLGSLSFCLAFWCCPLWWSMTHMSAGWICHWSLLLHSSGSLGSGLMKHSTTALGWSYLTNV